MSVLKKVLIGLAIVIAIPFVIAAFVKGEYKVLREITINRPKQDVFNYIKFMKNQENYSKWDTMDPAMKKSYSGTDGTIGFVSAWESKKDDVGVGEQEIKKITEGERVDFEIRFKEPFETTDAAFMTTETLSDSQTKVQWGFEGKMKYPMNLMMLFMDFEKIIGGDVETGLSRLKVVLEK